jgi:hypothetical protein
MEPNFYWLEGQAGSRAQALRCGWAPARRFGWGQKE